MDMAISKRKQELKRQRRQYLLSLKTNEELIRIILRKDKTELALQRKISMLMNEIKDLTQSVNDKDSNLAIDTNLVEQEMRTRINGLDNCDV